MSRTPWWIDSRGRPLAADRWDGAGPTVVLLHSGVCDRRSWYPLADELAGSFELVAYDRAGFGETPMPTEAHSDLDDLQAVLDALGGEQVWLVGSSKGAVTALEAALAAPGLTGLVLVAPAFTGAPPPSALDAATERLDDLLEQAALAGDLDEVNRLEAWLWLDGPAGPEGRVSGTPRELLLQMNALIMARDVDEDAGTTVHDGWERLDQVRLPTTVAWGDLEIPYLVERFTDAAGRIPGAQHRILPGTAHLPFLEQPKLFADLLRDSVSVNS